MEISFEHELRKRIQLKIQEHYAGFINDCLEYLKENFKTYRRIAFEEISDSKSYPFDLDYLICEKFIKESLKDREYIFCRTKKSPEVSWWENEIFFPFIERKLQIEEWGTPTFFAYREWRNNLEFECETAFWSLKEKQKNYSKFSSLKIFDDIIVNDKKRQTYQTKSTMVYDHNSWISYTQSLVNLFLDDFVLSQKHSNKQVKRYLNEVSAEVWFGFEYDENFIRRAIKNGELRLTEAFKLVLVTNESKVLTLGIFGNPFFYLPCYPMLGYSEILSYKRLTNGDILREIVKLSENEYQLVHSIEYGEELKKHAFFLMDILSSTLKPYLSLLKKSV